MAAIKTDTIPGIPPARANALARMGITSWKEFFHTVPIGYQDWRHVTRIADTQPGNDVTWKATVESIRPVFKGKRPFVIATITDGDISASVYWFHGLFALKQYKVGTEYHWHGRAVSVRGNIALVHPSAEKTETPKRIGTISPIYPAIKGFPSVLWARTWKRISSAHDQRIPWPTNTKKEVQAILGFVPVSLLDIYEKLHQPEIPEDIEKTRSAYTILEIAGRTAWRATEPEHTGYAMSVNDNRYNEYIQTLPYQLTPDQRMAADAIRNALAGTKPMRRLLQGDVGSGKTVVAGIAARIATENQQHVFLLAPTTLLAEQHAKTLGNLWKDSDALRIQLITTQKKPIPPDGPTVFVGTTALLHAQLPEARLCIVDEQHRFGVRQRAALEKSMSGISPHFLSLTATPIPRTIALIGLGFLQYDQLKTIPSGRKPIRTLVAEHPDQEQKTWEFCRHELAQGKRIYIVCPTIGERSPEAEPDPTSAISMHSWLISNDILGVMPGLLHGRMVKDEQEKVLCAFRSGEIQALVSTTVIEVGIDVPEATVMVILGAERFGLATLHQLRGRVGRGAEQSFCIMRPTLLNGHIPEHVRIASETSDGQKLAEMDFERRGSGTIFGTAQSGAVQDFRYPSALHADAMRVGALVGNAVTQLPQTEQNWWTTFQDQHSIQHLE